MPILDGWAALAEFYKGKGAVKAEAAIDAAAAKWAKLDDMIPWEQFVQMKRGFFDDANVNSSVMMRAYGHLMEASSKISKELAEANRAYALIRGAMKAGGVSVKTGNRTRDIGAISKPPIKSTGIRPKLTDF